MARIIPSYSDYITSMRARYAEIGHNNPTLHGITPDQSGDPQVNLTVSFGLPANLLEHLEALAFAIADCGAGRAATMAYDVRSLHLTLGEHPLASGAVNSPRLFHSNPVLQRNVWEGPLAAAEATVRKTLNQLSSSLRYEAGVEFSGLRADGSTAIALTWPNEALFQIQAAVIEAMAERGLPLSSTTWGTYVVLARFRQRWNADSLRRLGYELENTSLAGLQVRPEGVNVGLVSMDGSTVSFNGVASIPFHE